MNATNHNTKGETMNYATLRVKQDTDFSATIRQEIAKRMARVANLRARGAAEATIVSEDAIVTELLERLAKEMAADDANAEHLSDWSCPVCECGKGSPDGACGNPECSEFGDD